MDGGPVFRGRKQKRNESAREKSDAQPQEAAPCKKAESNHDQARIWASKVRVRTQLRTRNAITRVSNPLVSLLDPFLPDPVHSSFFFRLLSTSRDQDCVSLVPLSLLRALSIFLSRVMRPAEGEGKKEENKPWKRNLSSNTIIPFPFSKISYIDLYSRKGAARTGRASARPVVQKRGAERCEVDTSSRVSIRNARSAASSRAHAAACIAMQRSRHKTSCHTWGDRQPTPGYSRTSARFETKKRGTVGGRGEGDSEEAERRREFSRGRARNRRSKGRRDATGEREREKVEVEERVDRGGIEDRRGGEES